MANVHNQVKVEQIETHRLWRPILILSILYSGCTITLWR